MFLTTLPFGFSEATECTWPLRNSSTPHKCPVCDGRGDHMHGFYNECADTTNTARVPCRGCSGQGIIWAR